MGLLSGQILHSAGDMPGTLLTGAFSTVDSAAIGTTETVVQTSANTPVWKNGRVYQVLIAGRINQSGSATAQVKIRKGTTTAGLLLCDFGKLRTADGFNYAGGLTMLVANNSGADITSQICSTLQSDAGNTIWTGLSTSPRGFWVIDVGAVADFNGVAPMSFIT